MTSTSVWNVYRSYIIGAVLPFAFGTLMVVWIVARQRGRCIVDGPASDRVPETATQLAAITHLHRLAAMGEVTAAITHQLHQPLEAILRNAEAAELMLESGDTSRTELHDILADIRRIDRGAAELVQRLHGLLCRRDFETRPLNVDELVRETVTLASPVAHSTNVRVELYLAQPAASILGDPIHLHQVLLNVLLNGIEAMHTTPREHRRLVVGTQSKGDDVTISVTDRGIGIQTPDTSRIFEPFYTTKNEGMGMGLSIGRTIIEAHGGSIAARNNADGGATVWVTLRSREGAAEASRPQVDGRESTLITGVAQPITDGLDEEPMLREAIERAPVLST